MMDIKGKLNFLTWEQPTFFIFYLKENIIKNKFVRFLLFLIINFYFKYIIKLFMNY